jgi:hypothetical protein
MPSTKTIESTKPLANHAGPKHQKSGFHQYQSPQESGNETSMSRRRLKSRICAGTTVEESSPQSQERQAHRLTKPGEVCCPSSEFQFGARPGEAGGASETFRVWYLDWQPSLHNYESGDRHLTDNTNIVEEMITRLNMLSFNRPE